MRIQAIATILAQANDRAATATRPASAAPAAAGATDNRDRVSISQAAAARLAGGSAPSAAMTVQAATPGSTAGQPDYTHMTPAQMKDVAQSLYDSGKIDITELFMLQTAGMPLGKAGPQGEFIPLTEAERAAAEATPVNYIQTFTDGIRFMEKTGYAADPKSGYAAMQHILQILQG